MRINRHILWAILLFSAAFSTAPAFSDEEIELYARQSLVQGDLYTADSILTSGSMGHLDFRLSDFQVASLDAGQLMLLRNSIFARYGFRFSDDRLTGHFMRFPWYTPVSDDVSASITPVDQWNIHLIQFYEERLTTTASEVPEESDLVGFWHGSAAVGSGYSRRFFFYPTGIFAYRENSMDGSRRLSEICGKWELQDSHLILKADSVIYLKGGLIAEPYASYGSEFIIEGAEETGMKLNPAIVFRLPLSSFTRDYAAAHPEAGLDHLTVPFMEIGTGDYWRISGDPFAEYLE